jgi:hypothetical protein
MKRLFFMLVLTFSTVTFFANEKTEALPVENEIATPDFSMEDELREIRRQERRQKRYEKWQKNRYYSKIKAPIAGAFLLSATSIPINLALISVIPPLFTDTIFGGTLSFVFGCVLDPIIAVGLFIPGILILLNSLKKHKEFNWANAPFTTEYTNKRQRLFKNLAFAGIPFLSIGVTAITTGAAFLGIGTTMTDNFTSKGLPRLNTEFLAPGLTSLISGLALITPGVIFITTGLVGNYIYGKTTNRLSVDIGVTSGNNSELSCDKKRNALEKPSGVALALSVKF